jgi:hypothetical protein
MIVQHVIANSNKEESRNYNKDDTTNVTKVVARKSILMQIIKVTR